MGSAIVINNLLSQIAPTFLAGCKQIHDVLEPCVLLAMFAGLIVICIHAMQEKHISRFWPFFGRMAIAVILLTSLATWGDLVQSGVADVLSQTAFGSGPLPVAQAYEQALAAKFGTNSVASTGQTIQANQGTPTTEGDTSGGFVQPGSNTKITAYGFEKHGDPNFDTNSAAGIGNHNNTLVPLQSAALTASAAQQYGVQLGQAFQVAAANGSTYNLVYSDTAPESDSRIDIYDPQATLGGNNFESTATSVTDGTMSGPTVTNGQINMPSFGMNPATWASTIAMIFCYLLSIIALASMVIMTIIQNIAYLLLIAVSPIMISFMMLPALQHISTRFFTTIFSIALWPIGWILADLVTKLILTAVVASSSSSNNFAINAIGLGFSFGGWILLALWVIFSSIIAPIVISKAIVSGGTGVGSVMMGVLGATSFMAMRSASMASAAVPSGGSVSAESNTRMGGMSSPRFSRRPMSSKQEQES